MAKIIKFPLKMKNGAEVRSLEELQENFDLESVLGYFADGRLKTWLVNRYYDEKAEEVGALSADMPDLNARLCEILEVEYHPEETVADLGEIQRRNEKLRILQEITVDKDILDNIDLVAMDQDELYDILDETPEKVYLYGEKFEIPLGKKNVCYIGINPTVASLEVNTYLELYEKANIKFENLMFKSNINPYFTSGEKLFLEGKYQEAFPLIEQIADTGNPRAMYIMARYYNDGYNTVDININIRNECCKKASSFKEPLSLYGYASWCIDSDADEKNRIYLNIFEDIKKLAKTGDLFAYAILGVMYIGGNEIKQDLDQGTYWNMKAAEQGFAQSQYNLGYTFELKHKYTEANYWYKKAAEQGYITAQRKLGLMYENGHGVTQDYNEAVNWYKKSS